MKKNPSYICLCLFPVNANFKMLNCLPFGLLLLINCNKEQELGLKKQDFKATGSVSIFYCKAVKHQGFNKRQIKVGEGLIKGSMWCIVLHSWILSL